MNKKSIVLAISTITILSLITTGCGKVATLKNGEEITVSVKGGKISADKYYEEIKSTNISKLIDMIDHKLFDEKYKSDDKEKEYIENQIQQIKSYYTTDETFKSAIQQYFGVNNEDELKDVLSLEYKRNLAVKDYVESTVTEKEIKEYYKNNITGDIKASHILIKSDASNDATDEEKTKAEENAKKEAEDIIKKLKDGEDFSKLAKKYSDDTGSKENGGDLGYFSIDEMDEDFIEAVKKLNNNEYTKEPVKTQFGYHIILKVDQKEKPKLKKVKEDIIETIATNKLDSDTSLYYQVLIEIREKNKIKFNDSEIKKAYNNLMDQLIRNSTATN